MDVSYQHLMLENEINNIQEKGRGMLNANRLCASHASSER